MKKLLALLLFVAALSPVMAQQNEVCVAYFYSFTCPHCARVSPFLEDMQGKYPQVALHKYEISQNATNYQRFERTCTNRGILAKGVPLVVVGDTYLLGDAEIMRGFETAVEPYLSSGLACPQDTCGTVGGGGGPSAVTLPLVISAALVDSVNPCAFAVLIFLISYLTVLGSRKRVLRIGLVYVTTVYVTYFVAGVGLLSAVQSLRITGVIYVAAAVLAILAGLVNVKDFFWYGKGFSLQIPESKKGVIESWVKKGTVPAALVLGFLVSMFELPCTGGVYFAILGLLASTTQHFEAMSYLLIYNFFFVLPLLGIIALMYSGFGPSDMEKWRMEKRKTMKLVSGIVMIALGVIMLAGVV
ncbi:MAG: hypothetical protein JW834_03025 [Candidatus Diapherotrites archaeon]|nr:hypothetical protein [Candidatus Diapherotrites archaeon]